MRKELENKVIITAALCGTITPKSVNPHIPITPVEIAEDAYRCWQAGASVVHLHMRDDEGQGTMDSSKFREAINGIRAYADCDIIIGCTSSGTLLFSSDEERMRHFKLISEIEIGSFDAGTMNWSCNHVFDNSPEFLEKLGRAYQEHGVKPELEIFDSGMLGNVEHYIKIGVLKSPAYCQFCLGILGGMKATPENLMFLKTQLPPDAVWSAFGIGAAHMPIMYSAIAMGGHVRVGLEDNVYYSKGVKATNVQLVERAVQAIRLFGKDVATPEEAREILNLPQL